MDVQEQHAQAIYLTDHPNTDPRIHLFGNWQFAQTLVTPTWNTTLPELAVADGEGVASVYYQVYPTFAINVRSGTELEDRLRAFGVPKRTLDTLGWRYQQFDAIFRSRQGAFSLLSGSYAPETMVDAAEVRLWRFDAVMGTGRRYSSEYSYDQFIDADGRRETTVPALLTHIVDAVGHSVVLRPSVARD